MRRLLIGALAGLAVLGSAQAASADSATRVRLIQPDIASACPTSTSAGFCTSKQGDGTAVVAAGPAGAASGALQLQTPAGGDKVTVSEYRDTGMKLSDLKTVAYRSYITTRAEGTTQAPALNIEIDRNGGQLLSGDYATLVWEPTYSSVSPQVGTWQDWTPSGSTGGWWSRANGETTGVVGALGFPSYTAGWSDVVASPALSGATILSIGINQGSGNAKLASFVDGLAVNDRLYDFELEDRKPALALPTAISTEATGPGGATVSYTASASDAEDGGLPASCTPASGTTFAVGTTTVSCTATDSRQQTTTGSFSVTVTDTTPPTLTLPAAQEFTATTAAGAPVSYTATAKDAVDGTVATTCDPASGSTFPVGTTTVTCTATDKAGNTATGRFPVTVNYDARTVSVTSPGQGSTGVAVVRLVSPTGRNISAPGVRLAAVAIDGKPLAAGQQFVFVPFVDTYLYAFGTRGLSRGAHTLTYTAGADPLTHSITFRVS